LVYLVEVLTHEQPPNVVIPVDGPRQKMENISATLNFFSKKVGVQLPPVSIPLIINGNAKALMDLSWDIIYLQSISSVCFGGVPDRFGLLRWAQEHTKHFKNLQITDFCNSFKDGLAFCGIIADFHPGLIQFEELVPFKVLDNFRLAFKVAEEHWHVPKLLEPSDMLNDPDEISIIIYLGLCYTNFV